MDARFGRNDPCQCGSGKKYKRCCLDQDAAARSAELQAERDQLSLDLGAGDWRSDEEDEDDPFVESRTGYDPEIPPDPTRWLAIDEELRIDAIRRWHQHQHLPQPNHRLHATLHTIVENQLALREQAVVDALARLCHEGLTRHDAIHAIAHVLTEQLWDAGTAAAEPAATQRPTASGSRVSPPPTGCVSA